MASYGYQRMSRGANVAENQLGTAQQQKPWVQLQQQQPQQHATAQLLERQQQALEKLLAQQYTAVGQLLAQHRLELERSVVQQTSPAQQALPPPPKDPGSSDSDKLPSSDEETGSIDPPRKKNILKRGTTTTLHLVPTSRLQECCINLVSSHVFQVVMGSVIVLNAIFLGVSAHWHMTSLMEGGSPPRIVSTIFVTAKRCFFVLFVAEMAIRLLAEQCYFFYGKNMLWNWFELIALLSMGVELFDVKEIQEYLGEMSALRVLRLLRILRAMRVIRVFQFFKQLRFMLYSVLSCLLSMTWAIVLLILWMYLFGLYLEDAAIDYVKEHGKEADNEVLGGLSENWNGIFMAIRSLVYSVSGGADWGDLAGPFWDISWVNGVLYTVFMILTVFGLLNVLVGIFVQEAGEIVAWDRELVLEGLAERKELMMVNISELFEEMADEGEDRITMESFQRALKDERIQSYFEHLQINCTKVKALFGLMDMDHDGFLTKEEFIDACMQLHGDAKSTEVAHLVVQSKAIHQKVEKLGKAFDELAVRLAGPASR